jgi:hypothetical protein
VKAAAAPTIPACDHAKAPSPQRATILWLGSVGTNRNIGRAGIGRIIRWYRDGIAWPRFAFYRPILRRGLTDVFAHRFILGLAFLIRNRQRFVP